MRSEGATDAAPRVEQPQRRCDLGVLERLRQRHRAGHAAGNARMGGKGALLQGQQRHHARDRGSLGRSTFGFFGPMYDVEVHQ